MDENLLIYVQYYFNEKCMVEKKREKNILTYVVLKGYLSNPIDCVKPAIATEPGKVYRKNSSFQLY